MVPPLLHVCNGVFALRVIERFVLDIRHFGKGGVALMRLPSRRVQALPEVVPEALVPLLLVYSGVGALLHEVRVYVLHLPGALTCDAMGCVLVRMRSIS